MFSDVHMGSVQDTSMLFMQPINAANWRRQSCVSLCVKDVRYALEKDNLSNQHG